MVARNAPIRLKNPCFCCFVAVSVVGGSLLFFPGGGKTTGSSCTTLLFSSFKVATISLRSGAGWLARKTNGASTATCSSGEGAGRGLGRHNLLLARAWIPGVEAEVVPLSPLVLAGRPDIHNSAWNEPPRSGDHP